MINQDDEESAEKRRALVEAIAGNELSLGQAVRRMREIAGMNQKDYARTIIGISPRILAEIELGRGNPTVETLNKIGRPFGFAAGFVPIQSGEPS